MEYYFDEFGILSAYPIPGRSTDVAPPDTTLPPGHVWRWEGYSWAPFDPTPVLATPATIYTKLTKRAFQDRFPLTSNGISRKYDRMDLFLRDDGYAATLGVTGANLYELRLMITTGINRLNASSHVDYSMPDAANFLTLLTNPVIPEAFRLTESERTVMLETPISESEKFTG